MRKTKLNRIQEVMENKHMYPTFYHGIAEMGYDDKELITADWWQRKTGKLRTPLMDYLNEMYPEIETEFYDEWTSCSICGKAVRTSPTSYGWETSYVWLSDCEIACHECCEEHDIQSDVIEHYLNDTDKAVPSWFYQYLNIHGFICYSPNEYCKRFETGWYPGQNDMPQDVAKDIEENLPGYDYLFKIESVGQFDIHWNVFLRKQV